MIPEAAVEAAAKALAAADLVPDRGALYRYDARLALEAAAPHMLAAAFDVGFTACAPEHMRQDKDPNHPITRINPYRSES